MAIPFGVKSVDATMGPSPLPERGIDRPAIMALMNSFCFWCSLQPRQQQSANGIAQNGM